MDDLGRMHVAHASENLRHKVLVMRIRESLTGADDLGKIGFASGKDEVDFGKVDKGGVKVEEGGDVVAHANVTEKRDFAESSACKNILFKDASHLFDGNVAFQDLVTTEGYATVSTNTKLTNKSITLLDVKGDAEAAERVVAASGKIVRSHGMVVVGVSRSTVGARGGGRHISTGARACARALSGADLVENVVG